MAIDYRDLIFFGESPTTDGYLYDTLNYYRNLTAPPPSISAPISNFSAPAYGRPGLSGLYEYLAPTVTTRAVPQDFLPILETGRRYTEPVREAGLPAVARSRTERTFKAFDPFDVSRAQTVNFPTGIASVAPASPPGDIVSGDGGGGGDFGGDSTSPGPGLSASQLGESVAMGLHSITSNPSMAMLSPVSFTLATLAQNALTPSLVAPEDAVPISTTTQAMTPSEAQAQADAMAAEAGHFGFGYGDPGEGGASSAGMGGASEGSAGSTAATADSPDGPDGSNASADGGGGGGGGGKIICTKLYQLGLLDEDIYLADQAFGAKLVKTNPDIYNGYRAWAEIVVDWMSGDGPNMMPWLSEKRRREISQSWSTAWAKEIATPWAEEMAYKMGVKASGNTTGKLITAAGIPICKAVGVWQKIFGPSKKPAGFGKGAMLIPVFVLFKLIVKFGRLVEGKKAPSLQGT